MRLASRKAIEGQIIEQLGDSYTFRDTVLSFFAALERGSTQCKAIWDTVCSPDLSNKGQDDANRKLIENLEAQLAHLAQVKVKFELMNK